MNIYVIFLYIEMSDWNVIGHDLTNFSMVYMIYVLVLL